LNEKKMDADIEEEKDAFDLIYKLEDNPPVQEAMFAALQHLLAIIVGIITPTLIIGGVLGLGSEIPYLISMALIVSGVATFIQVKRIGPVGSGILSIQGTSFAFLGAILTAGFMVKNQGGGTNEILSTIFGLCFFGAFIEMILSRFLQHLRKIITPVVTGTVVTLIGLSLVKVGIMDMAGGKWLLDNKPDLFGSAQNLFLAFLVLAIVIILTSSKNQFLRMGSIVIGLIVGYIIAAFMGKVNFSALQGLPLINIPIPFKYGFSFNLTAFIPVAFIYLITTIESTGDLTATSMVSGQPIEGDLYIKRIKGGVLGDGVNSAMAAMLNTFPNTTFSQNNGVIQLTGIASRLPERHPSPVLGGATIIMFGTVGAAGIRIIASSEIDRRDMIIMAAAFGLGFGVAYVPEFLSKAPKAIQQIFGSAVTTGGITALLLNTFLPGRKEK